VDFARYTRIIDYRLDVFAMTEPWITSDAPAAIKLDVAPPGYEVVHRHRGSSTDKRGGGVAVIHRQTIKATTVDVGDYTEFESLAVKLVCRQSKSLIVVCVYRPPGAVTSTFTDQLSDLLDQLLTFNTKFVVVGDFNVPGCATAVQLDHCVVDVFEQYTVCVNMSAVQHTPAATCSTSSCHRKTTLPADWSLTLLYRRSAFPTTTCCASRASVVVISTRDNRRGQEAVVSHAKQVVTTGCAAVFSAEVVFRSLCTSHCQTSQPIDADWKVPCPLQTSAGATTAEETRA